MADELSLDEADIEEFLATRIKREDRDINSFVSDLIAFLSSQLYRQLRRAGPLTSLTSREALRFLGGLESALDDAGLAERLETLKDLFDLQIALAKEEFVRTTGIGRPPALSEDGRAFVPLFVGTRKEAVRQLVIKALGDVREGLVNRIISGDQQGLSDVEIVDNAVGRISDGLAKELKTSVAAFNRFVRQDQMARVGLSYVLYAGPKDAKNRVFCAIRARNVYTLKEIEKWDNGQGLPANIYCGGYNCRHELVPLSDELADKLIKERGLPGVNYYDYSHRGSGRV